MNARATLLVLFAIVAIAVRAQDPLVEALRKYQAGDLQGAQVLVDAAAVSYTHLTLPTNREV